MRSRKWLPLAALIHLAAPAAAVQQPPLSVQQRFEAATDALDESRWADALRLFEELETHLGRARDSRSLGLVRVRKAEALIGLDRLEDAVAALQSGRPALPATDCRLNGDRFRGHLTLGRAHELALDYREAAAYYGRAAAIEMPAPSRIELFRGLIQTRMFFDAPSALAAADEGLALVASMRGGAGLEGQFRTLRGRVLLNMGRTADARTELDRAMQLLGGLTQRVDIRDVIARSDLAIAAMLGGRAADARRYLAMTGAGRMPRSSLDSPQSMPAPPCGNGLTPDDVAIVQLALATHGGVASVTPVYSSRQGDAALIFARAAQSWHWLPESSSRLEPIFRLSIRVEMRCDTAGAERRIADQNEVASWADANRVPISLSTPTNRSAVQLRGDLAEAEARFGADSPQLLPVLVRLGRTLDLDRADRARHWQRAFAIATAAGAPGPYRAMIGRALVGALAGEAERSRPYTAQLLALTEAVPVSGDPFLLSLAMTAAAERHLYEREMDQAAALIARIRSQPDFRDKRTLMATIDDLAVAVETARGGQAAGRAAYELLPAGTFGCSARQPIRRATFSDSDFPQVAQSWGFEGWLEIEPIVGTSERAVSARAIAAYPPFIFNTGGLAMVERFRFEPAFVPPGGACAGMTQKISFRLPR